MADALHKPVMLKEVLEHLDPREGKLILDATLGAAGHTLAMAKRGAQIIAIDRDQRAIDIANKAIEQEGLRDQVEIRRLEFSKINELSRSQFDGELFDLGVSSMQLDEGNRGFSFSKKAPLDMRMDEKLSVTAQDLVNGLGRKELYELFTKYAQEYRARELARAIVHARKIKPITTTTELASIVSGVKGFAKGKNPATQVFQALRIAVNDELGELKAALPSALSMLKPGGACVVISFHSLEDRIVKNIFIEHEEESYRVRTKKPLIPTQHEINTNRRARSAKMRVIERLQ